MKTIEISYSEGKTIQESSYEPRTFHFSAKAELSGDDNIAESFDQLKREVKFSLNREVLKWRDPKKFIKQEQDTKELEF